VVECEVDIFVIVFLDSSFIFFTTVFIGHNHSVVIVKMAPESSGNHQAFSRKRGIVFRVAVVQIFNFLHTEFFHGFLLPITGG